jgi:hypothetical protein
MRLLVAENDPALGTFLERGFHGEHYLVELTSDGERTQSRVEEWAYAAGTRCLALLPFRGTHNEKGGAALGISESRISPVNARAQLRLRTRLHELLEVKPSRPAGPSHPTPQRFVREFFAVPAARRKA